MPRNWKKKTERIRNSSLAIKEAINEVVIKGMPLRAVSKAFNISKSTLCRYVKEAKQNADIESYVPNPNVGNRKIFSCNEENELCEYLLISSQMCYGLTTNQTRKLAFDYAQFLGKVPLVWQKNETAGKDWLLGFLSRHQELSIHSPENTSQSRASSFNRNNTNLFLQKLEGLQKKYKFDSSEIYNCDETGLSTVTECPKIIAKRGTKQVGQITSAERGELVTMLNFISASGNTIPPVYIFPRVNYKDFMLENGPSGSLGLAYPSGWMTTENFFKAIEHFVKHTKCTKEKPVLLIMDNHDSHIHIKVISFAKEHGVVMLTFPPHCSHRMQPLDVAVYSPFKMRYRIAQNNWLTNHPGKNITIYNIAAFSNIAFVSAFTKQNIISGFQKTGIYPLNTEIFTDEDFLSASVTDRPLVSEGSITEQDFSIASTSSSFINSSGTSTESFAIKKQNSPLTTIRSYPKASPRKTGRRGRKRGSCRVLTDTPEKRIIEEQQIAKTKKQKQKIIKNKTLLNEQKNSSASDSDTLSLHDESDSIEDEGDLDNPIQNHIPDNITEDDFILTKFTGKKKVICYVARVLKNNIENLQVQFLKKKDNSFLFYYTDMPEIYIVDFEDIIMKLPKPRTLGTERTKGLMSFDVNFNQYDVK